MKKPVLKIDIDRDLQAPLKKIAKQNRLSPTRQINIALYAWLNGRGNSK